MKKKISKAFAALFDYAARNSVSYVCLWILHQPEEPAALRESTMD